MVFNFWLQARGVSRAATTLATPCGDIHLGYQVHGGVQCARVPEGRSLLRPHGPANTATHANVDCGAVGGVITRVDFASWGAPAGQCGNWTVTPACHVPAVMAYAEATCLGRTQCAIPVSADNWLGSASGTHGARRLIIFQQ
jgi:hypothetical protein